MESLCSWYPIAHTLVIIFSIWLSGEIIVEYCMWCNVVWTYGTVFSGYSRPQEFCCSRKCWHTCSFPITASHSSIKARDSVGMALTNWSHPAVWHSWFPITILVLTCTCMQQVSVRLYVHACVFAALHVCIYYVFICDMRGLHPIIWCMWSVSIISLFRSLSLSLSAQLWLWILPFNNCNIILHTTGTNDRTHP